MTFQPDQGVGGSAAGTGRRTLTRRRVLFDWLDSQPLVPPAAGLVVGIALDAATRLPSVLGLLLFGLAGAAVVLLRWYAAPRHVATLLAAFAVGAAAHDLSFRHWPANHIVRYIGDEGTPAAVTATVVSPARVRPSNSGRITWFEESPRTSFLVEADNVRGVHGEIDVSGLLQVTVHEPLESIGVGDRVQLSGTLFRPSAPSSPGQKDWRLIRRRNGALAGMSCSRADHVAMISAARGSSTWLASSRRWAQSAMLDQTYDDDVPGSQFLSTMVLGQRSAVDPDLNQVFVNTGTVHYLSVSGAHVGMLVSVVWLVGVLAGVSRRSCAGTAIVLVIAYALIAEPQAPILRSAVMAVLLCFALLLRRPVRTANALALSLLILLPVWPTQLFDAGFQMSYATVIALICLSPRVYAAGRTLFRKMLRRNDPLLSPEIQDMLNPPSRLRLAWRWVLRAIGASLSVGVPAWLVSAPLGAYHFQQVAFWGWLNTLLVMPLMWIVLVLGLLKTVLAIVIPHLAAVLGWPLAAVTNVLIAFVRRLALLPGSGVPTPALPAWLTGLMLATVCFWILAPWLRASRHWIGCTALGVIVLAAWNLAPAGRSDELRMHMLPVGNGTACVIQLPSGRTIVYDIGCMPPRDLERWTVGPLLAAERVYRIDAAMISHPDVDHFSALPDLLSRRAVDQVLVTPHFDRFAARGRSPARLRTDVREHGVAWRPLMQGQRLKGTGDAVVEVLWPPPVDVPLADSNETSMVVRISYCGQSILLCGDIKEQAQSQLIRSGNLKADVLVLPHHGSIARTTEEFIEAVDPSYCIRSSAQRRSDPTRRALSCLEGRQCFETADDGEIEVRLTRNGLRVKPWRRR